MRTLMTMLCGICVLVCWGCSNSRSTSGSSTKTGNLLSGLGLKSNAVTSVTIDTRSRVFVVKDAATIRQFYSAIDQPDSARSRDILDNLMGFTTTNGKTVVGAFSRAGDVSARQGSTKIIGLVRQVKQMPGARVVAVVPPLAITSASIIRQGHASASPASRVSSLQAKTQQLVGMWNPDSLEGCIAEGESAFLSQKEPVVVLNLSKPIRFRCFVRDSAEKRPPQYPQWAGTYETLTCSPIAVSKDENGHVQFAFYEPASRRWYVTQRLHLYNKKGQETYAAFAESYGDIVRLASP